MPKFSKECELFDENTTENKPQNDRKLKMIKKAKERKEKLQQKKTVALTDQEIEQMKYEKKKKQRRNASQTYRNKLKRLPEEINELIKLCNPIKQKRGEQPIPLLLPTEKTTKEKRYSINNQIDRYFLIQDENSNYAHSSSTVKAIEELERINFQSSNKKLDLKTRNQLSAKVSRNEKKSQNEKLKKMKEMLTEMLMLSHSQLQKPIPHSSIN